MLVLTADETAALLDMPMVLAALEPAYLDLAAGRAGGIPRADVLVPTGRPGAVHGLKTMSGSVPRVRTAAIRLNSDIVHWPDDGAGPRRVKIPAAGPGRWVGLVLLFDTETGAPVAIFPDGHVQRMRVAAACALAARRMCRPDARVMGLFGSGFQAGSMVLAMAAVLPLERVQVYSPTPDHRAHFAAEMTAAAGVPVVAVDTPAAAAAGADLICAATNHLGHVVTEEMVRPGQFLTNIRTHEFSPGVYRRAGRIIFHTREATPQHVLVGQEGPESLPELKSGWENRAFAEFDWSAVPLLHDLVSGAVPGRGDDEEVTVFVNNMGIGIQFAAVGAALVARARERGAGRDLPLDWFLQDVHP